MRFGEEVCDDPWEQPRRLIRDVTSLMRFGVYCRRKHPPKPGSGLLAVLTTDGFLVTDLVELPWPDCGSASVVAVCQACEHRTAYPLSVEKIKKMAASRRSEVDVRKVLFE